MTRRALLVALVLAAGACKKQEKAAPVQQEAPVPPLSADELKRSEDACKVYVERACSCAATIPAAVKECADAKPLPDAMRISLEVSLSPESKPDVVRQTQAGVRKTVKTCIEQTAKLPALGCPTR